MYVCVYVCMYVYIYIYTHTYTYIFSARGEAERRPSRARAGTASALSRPGATRERSIDCD